MSSSAPTYQQRQIVRNMIRRNIQGWGRPLSYTLQRMRIGGYIGVVALVSVAIDNIISITKIVSANSGVHVLLFFITLLAAVMGGGLILSVALNWYRAVSQPVTRVTGTIEATICSPQDFLSTATDLYHFFTLRLPNGRLRPFAVDAALHDRVCRRGQKVTLTVVPGIDYITKVE